MPGQHPIHPSPRQTIGLAWRTRGLHHGCIHGIPYTGPLQIALDDCKDDLIDLPPDTLLRLRKVKPGIENVRSELQMSVGDRFGPPTLEVGWRDVGDQLVTWTQPLTQSLSEITPAPPLFWTQRPTLYVPAAIPFTEPAAE